MLLLLFNSSIWGTLKWPGPEPLRTAVVELDNRTAQV